MLERLGLVQYANVAPLHFGLTPWAGCEFVYGVPTKLNSLLLAGEVKLALISSIEFLQHRHKLKALPDFSISTLGPVYSVMLFHLHPWENLNGKHIALSSHSATSVQLLKLLLADEKLDTEFVFMEPNLDAMLSECDGALLIGDRALVEAIKKRSIKGQQTFITDLGAKWYQATKLPFTFAVWASHKDDPPSEMLVTQLRKARERGLGQLAEVSRFEAERLKIPLEKVQRYLSNFRYYLELPDRDGLIAFAERSFTNFKPKELSFWEI